MDSAALSHRFDYHPPGADRARQHEHVRDLIGSMAHELNDRLPEGREKSLVITHLEETMFWANAALARS